MRQITPNLLDTQPAPAPTYDLAGAMTAAPTVALRYDYAALGAAGDGIRAHAIAIKLTERRMAEATVEAGNHLIAVKETIPHGHWLTWLADELSMTDDAAQTMMQIARRFGPKTESIRYLSPTVLALLAAKSVPDEAVEAAITASATEAVTVRTAKAIIASHRPARCRKCGRTLTDPQAAANGIGACCAAKLVRGAAVAEEATVAATVDQTVADVVEVYGEPLPEWAQDSTPEPSPAPPQGESASVTQPGADPREAALAALAARLVALVEEVRELGQTFGDLTGDFTTPLAVKHGIEKMRVVVQANMPNGGWD